jgi:hypothetical protein
MKCYSPTGKRNHGRPLKRLLDTWDQNGSTSGPTPWQIYDDDNDDDDHHHLAKLSHRLFSQFFKSWIKSHLLSSGIIRSSPFSPR